MYIPIPSLIFGAMAFYFAGVLTPLGFLMFIGYMQDKLRHDESD